MIRRVTVVTSAGELYRQLARDFHFMARSLPPGEDCSRLLNAAEEWDRRADQEECATDLHRKGLNSREPNRDKMPKRQDSASCGVSRDQQS
jgi:hypothetical protein